MDAINKARELRKFGQALNDVRSSKGISLTVLAEKTGIDQNVLQQIEQGKCDFEYITLLIIAKALNSKLYQLLPVPDWE